MRRRPQIGETTYFPLHNVYGAGDSAISFYYSNRKRLTTGIKLQKVLNFRIIEKTDGDPDTEKLSILTKTAKITLHFCHIDNEKRKGYPIT